ncbi:MAG: histone deacetylase family protein [bacterium]
MRTTVVHSDELENYDFGPGHPFRSDRFPSFLRLYQEKLGRNKNFELVKNNEPASDEELELWHTKDYIQAMKAASSGITLPNLHRFISQDNINPMTGEFPKGIEKGARTIVKNSILALDFVQEGKSEKAVNIGGGLHHAKSNYGEGFCVYNDVVIAARHALKKYNLERILILDTDAHAGNGTCEAFYSDPRVLFVDLHQAGIYPGTGFAHEIGEGEGKGYTVNLPLAAGTSDRSYEMVFDEIVLPLAEEYRPEIVIRYGGSDPHPSDEITQLGLHLPGFKMIGEKVRQISELCDNKSLDLICSGYKPEVLARVWLALITSLSGIEIELEEPELDIKSDAMLIETKDMIKEVKENLKPYWRSMKP